MTSKWNVHQLLFVLSFNTNLLICSLARKHSAVAWSENLNLAKVIFPSTKVNHHQVTKFGRNVMVTQMIETPLLKSTNNMQRSSTLSLVLARVLRHKQYFTLHQWVWKIHPNMLDMKNVSQFFVHQIPKHVPLCCLSNFVGVYMFTIRISYHRLADHSPQKTTLYTWHTSNSGKSLSFSRFANLSTNPDGNRPNWVWVYKHPKPS